MFEVEIKNLKTKARIGISVQERKKFQTLLITVRFKYLINNKKKLDSIEHLKNYSSIIKFLKLFIEKSAFKSLERLVFGAKDPKGGACGSLFNVPVDPRINHRVSVTSGILENESIELLQNFFGEKRKVAKETKTAKEK